MREALRQACLFCHIVRCMRPTCQECHIVSIARLHTKTAPRPAPLSTNRTPIAIPLQTRRTRTRRTCTEEGPDSKIDRLSPSLFLLFLRLFPPLSLLRRPDKTSHKSGVMRHQRRPEKLRGKKYGGRDADADVCFKPTNDDFAGLVPFGQSENLNKRQGRMN